MARAPAEVAILASSFLSSFSIEMRSLANATLREAEGARRQPARREATGFARARGRARRRAKVKKM